MGKSPWTIAILGLMGVLVMGIFAFLAAPGYRELSEKKLKWLEMAARIKNQFGFKDVKAIADENVDTVTVHVQTSKYLSFSQKDLDEEVKQIAAFCVSQVPAERDNVRKLKLIREEVIGGGCSEKRSTSDMVVDLPPPARAPSPIPPRK